MGAIIDILLLEEGDTEILRRRYPNCVLRNETNSAIRCQRYRLIIPDEDQYGDSYYNFLLDNSIATTSRNFQARFGYDEAFRERIRARAAENVRARKAGLTDQKPAATSGSDTSRS